MDKSPLQDEIGSCIRVYADRVQIQQCIDRLLRLEPTIARLEQSMILGGGGVARFKIMFLLEQETGLCVCDLSDILDMPIPAVYQHLQKLNDAQLIQARKVGQTVFFSLKKEAI